MKDMLPVTSVQNYSQSPLVLTKKKNITFIKFMIIYDVDSIFCIEISVLCSQ